MEEVTINKECEEGEEESERTGQLFIVELQAPSDGEAILNTHHLPDDQVPSKEDVLPLLAITSGVGGEEGKGVSVKEVEVEMSRTPHLQLVKLSECLGEEKEPLTGKEVELGEGDEASVDQVEPLERTGNQGRRRDADEEVADSGENETGENDPYQEDKPSFIQINTEMLCCNCNKLSEKVGEPGMRLSDSFTCSVYQSTSRTLESCKISVVDALGNLFFERNPSNILKDRDLWMCSNCLSTFTNLYKLYNEFIFLSVEANAVLAEHLSFHSQKRSHLTTQRSAAPPIHKLHSKANNSKTRKIAKILRQNINNAVLVKRGNESVKRKFMRSDRAVKGSNLKRNHQHHTRLPKTLGNFVSSKAKSRQRSPLKNEKLVQEMLEDSANDDDDIHMDSETTCDRCGKTLKSASGLKIHYAAHLRDDNKFECKECDKKFRKQEALELHEKIDHGGYKPHRCPHEGCDRSFRLKDKLKLHIKVVHEKRMPFPCPKCEKSFRTKYHLKIHDVSQHVQGENSASCSQCKRKFNSREALEIHLKTHEEEKSFVCIKCHKGFHTSARLKLHAKSHEVVPSCICAVCGKAYKHIRDLRLHEVIHQDESTYRFGCGDCPKKFYRIDLLRVHQSNEKHFSQEIVGPSISKQRKKTDKSEKNGKSSSAKRKRKSTAASSNIAGVKNEDHHLLLQPLESTDAFSSRNLLQLDTLEEISAHREAHMELSPLHNPTILPSQKIVQDIVGPATFIINPSPRSLHGNNVNLPLNQSSAGAIQLTSGNTIYTLRDTNDRNVSAFSISAGAEQIGFDVINAFINNLN